MASYILLAQIKSPYTSCSLFTSGAIFLYPTIMFSKSFLFSTLFSLFYQRYHWPPDSSLLPLQHGYCFSFPWSHVVFLQLWIARWEFSPEHSYVFPFHMPLGVSKSPGQGRKQKSDSQICSSASFHCVQPIKVSGTC